MIIRELNHVGLFTHDIDSSIAFYRDVLGGTLIRNAWSADGKSRFVYVQVGVSVLELIGAGADTQAGFAHVAYLTGAQGLDASYETLAAQGFTFSVPPKPAASGDGRLAFFRDLSGSTFELIQREENIRKPAFGTPAVAAFEGIALNVPPDKLSGIDAFYTQTLGLERRGNAWSGTRYGILGDHLIVRAGEPYGIDSIVLTAGMDARNTLAKSGVTIVPSDADSFEVFGPDGEKLVFYTAKYF
jgi:catechol 2,3-dioxygenase-like lactoylglutathione lyase family enzyme